MRAIPGRTGVPLSYVTRENDAANPDSNVDFLDDYILNAPLSGADYLTDRRAVHTKLVDMVSTNPEAETWIKLNEKDADGRKDWKDLQLQYEGQVMFALEIKEAKRILDNLVHTGERPPQIYWTKFEQQLITAFATYAKVEGRIVHSDIMKLTHSMTKVKCDLLNAVTAALTVSIQENLNYTYAMALKVYKAEVGKSGT